MPQAEVCITFMERKRAGRDRAWKMRPVAFDEAWKLVAARFGRCRSRSKRRTARNDASTPLAPRATRVWSVSDNVRGASTVGVPT
jgi:hypothetical protein